MNSDDLLRQLDAERFGQAVRCRNSLRPVDEGAWLRLRELRAALAEEEAS